MGYPPSATYTVSAGDTILADHYNTANSDWINNNIPENIDDYSATEAEMQSTADPYPASAVSQATSLDGELERLRYVIAQLSGETYWYVDPDNSVATINKSFLRDKARNLVIGAVTDNTVDIDASELILEDTSGNVKRVTSVNLTIDTDTDWTANGSVANGLGRDDDGTLDASTWYYIWVVNGSTGTAGVVTKQATLATCLANAVSTGGEYDTYGALVGMIYSDATNDLVAINQTGNRVTYVAAGVLANAGSSTVYSSMNATLATLIPSNAVTVFLRGSVTNDGTAADYTGHLYVSNDGTNDHLYMCHAGRNATGSTYLWTGSGFGEIDIVTAQTLWYKVGHANLDGSLWVLGFTFEATD